MDGDDRESYSSDDEEREERLARAIAELLQRQRREMEEEAERTREQLETQLTVSSDTITSLQNELREMRKLQAYSTGLLEESDFCNQSLRCQLDESRRRCGELHRKVTEAENEIHDLEVELLERTGDCDSLQRELHRKTTDLKKTSDELSRMQEMNVELEEEIERLNAEMEEMAQAEEEYKAALEFEVDLEKEIEVHRDEIVGLSNVNTDLNDQNEKLKKELQEALFTIACLKKTTDAEVVARKSTDSSLSAMMSNTLPLLSPGQSLFDEAVAVSSPPPKAPTMTTLNYSPLTFYPMLNNTTVGGGGGGGGGGGESLLNNTIGSLSDEASVRRPVMHDMSTSTSPPLITAVDGKEKISNVSVEEEKSETIAAVLEENGEGESLGSFVVQQQQQEISENQERIENSDRSPFIVTLPSIIRGVNNDDFSLPTAHSIEVRNELPLQEAPAQKFAAPSPRIVKAVVLQSPSSSSSSSTTNGGNSGGGVGLGLTSPTTTSSFAAPQPSPLTLPIAAPLPTPATPSGSGSSSTTVAAAPSALRASPTAMLGGAAATATTPSGSSTPSLITNVGIGLGGGGSVEKDSGDSTTIGVVAATKLGTPTAVSAAAAAAADMKWMDGSRSVPLLSAPRPAAGGIAGLSIPLPSQRMEEEATSPPPESLIPTIGFLKPHQPQQQQQPQQQEGEQQQPQESHEQQQQPPPPTTYYPPQYIRIIPRSEVSGGAAGGDSENVAPAIDDPSGLVSRGASSTEFSPNKESNVTTMEQLLNSATERAMSNLSPKMERLSSLKSSGSHHLDDLIEEGGTSSAPAGGATTSTGRREFDVSEDDEDYSPPCAEDELEKWAAKGTASVGASLLLPSERHSPMPSFPPSRVSAAGGSLLAHATVSSGGGLTGLYPPTSSSSFINNSSSPPPPPSLQNDAALLNQSANVVRPRLSYINSQQQHGSSPASSSSANVARCSSTPLGRPSNNLLFQRSSLLHSQSGGTDSHHGNSSLLSGSSLYNQLLRPLQVGTGSGRTVIRLGQFTGPPPTVKVLTAEEGKAKHLDEEDGDIFIFLKPSLNGVVLFGEEANNSAAIAASLGAGRMTPGMRRILGVNSSGAPMRSSSTRLLRPASTRLFRAVSMDTRERSASHGDHPPPPPMSAGRTTVASSRGSLATPDDENNNNNVTSPSKDVTDVHIGSPSAATTGGGATGAASPDWRPPWMAPAVDGTGNVEGPSTPARGPSSEIQQQTDANGVVATYSLDDFCLPSNGRVGTINERGSRGGYGDDTLSVSDSGTEATRRDSADTTATSAAAAAGGGGSKPTERTFYSRMTTLAKKISSWNSRQAEKAPGMVPRHMWVPDNFEVTCRLCGEAFSMFNRRHHCRSCGHLFCAACTKKKMKLAIREETVITGGGGNDANTIGNPTNSDNVYISAEKAEKYTKQRVCYACLVAWESQKSLLPAESFVEKMIHREDDLPPLSHRTSGEEGQLPGPGNGLLTPRRMAANSTVK